MRGAAPAPANSPVTAPADPANSSVTAASDPTNSSGVARSLGDGRNVLMEYFTGNVDCGVPNLASLRPQLALLIPDMLIPKSSAYNPVVYGIRTGTNWAARFSSLLDISQGGRYTFQIHKTHADSAALTIDGHQVVAAGCDQHQPRGNMSLTAGYHEVVLTYTDDGWQDMMELSFSGPDTHGSLQKVPASRFEADQWVLGAQGQSCDTVCQSLDKVCHPFSLTRGATPTEIISLAAKVSYTCANTRAWSYSPNPSICTDPRCCTDGSCIGWCYYGNTVARRCSAGEPHKARICPCTMRAYLPYLR